MPQPNNLPPRNQALKREAILLIDHRTYRIKPGHTQTHLAIYEEFGLRRSGGISASRSPTCLPRPVT